MDRYIKLGEKLKNNEIVNLLFVSPNYGPVYPYSDVETSYFSKDKFNCHVKLITNDDISSIIDLFINSNDYDCIINMCDGYINNKDGIPGLNFMEELEKHNIPFTGADKRVFSISKYEIQQSKYTPKTIHVSEYLNDNSSINCLKFPLFIKPNNLGCSEHVDNNSVINSMDELNAQIQKISKFTNDIIIQEYIDGDEYTALVFKNRYNEIICLPPINIIFSNTQTNYLTNYIKIHDCDSIIYDYDVDKNISEEIKQHCIYVYEHLNLNSYVRMDVRNTTIIDINSYPEIFGPREEEDMNDVIIREFYNFDDFMYDILYDALRRSH